MNANTDKQSRHSVQRLVMPQTEAEWCAYRCQLSCKIGREVLAGKTQTPIGVSPLEYAVFNLLHAVEELSRQNAAGEQPPPTTQTKL
jgi:hypothetical protein